jgi:hypothetical protein
MFTIWQGFVAVKVIRPERFAHAMFFTEPFAEINQLATTRAERTELSRKPFTFFPARRTFDLLYRPFHRLKECNRCGWDEQSVTL